MWNPHIVPAGFIVRTKEPISPSAKEREILRGLAGKARSIADHPEMAERKKLWKNHNGLKSEKPMILADPECAWEELVPLSELVCVHPTLKEWELNLRKRIFWWENINDDDVVEPYFDIPWVVTIGNYGVEALKTQGEHRGSYTWKPSLNDIGDFKKVLAFRKLTVDRALTRYQVETAGSIFGDILPVRIRGKYWWSVGLTLPVIEAIGLENLMLYMYDRPDDLHALMAWFRDEQLHVLDWFEKEGLLTDTNENDYVGSGGIAYTDELPQKDRNKDEPVRLKDIWGFAESQETVGVSPEMFEEFIFPYQAPLLEKFGLNCYGCCEPIEKRIHTLKRIPRLRRLSVSAWADEEKAAREIGKDYIYSRKPNPAAICVSFNEEKIRRDLQKTLQTARGCNLEFNMKDTHTLQNEPWRITRWVELAREQIARYWK